MYATHNCESARPQADSRVTKTSFVHIDRSDSSFSNSEMISAILWVIVGYKKFSNSEMTSAILWVIVGYKKFRLHETHRVNLRNNNLCPYIPTWGHPAGAGFL